MSEGTVPYFPRQLGMAGLGSRLYDTKLLVFDVDGTLTDGTIGYCGKERILLFNTHDGHGIRTVADSPAGVEVAFCTTNRAECIGIRAKALHVTYVLQGREDKAKAIEELGVPWDRICYVGDDLIDMVPMMKAGVAIAVNNATDLIQRIAHHVTTKDGGKGAAREVCDLILAAKGYEPRVNVETQMTEWRKAQWPLVQP